MLSVFRIRTLLVAVALLPLAGLATFAIRDALTRWEVTRDVELVVSDAELIDHLLVAKEAAATELDGIEAVWEAASFGVDLAYIRDVIGIDLESSLAPARSRFDAAIGEIVTARAAGAEFARPDDVEAIVAGLERKNEIGDLLDTGEVEERHVAEFRELILDPLDRATGAQLEALADHAALLGEDGIVADAASQARQAVLVADLVRREGVWLSKFVVPIRPVGPDTTYQNFLVNSALARQEVDRLESTFDEVGLAEWQNVSGDPSYLTYIDLRDAAVAGDIDPLASFDLDNVTLAANGAVNNNRMTADFTDAMNERVIDEAELAGAIARDELRRSAILAGLIGLATLLGIALLSRSLVKPLHRLETRARRITEGDLGDGAERSGGPREVAVVDQALNELVAGLEVLETQAEALSIGDLSSPILQEASPGRLGESLQASVHRLSEMAARLDHQAHHDQLTGLLNRTAGIEAIERSLARAQRTSTDVAVLFIDLDGFKDVNDVHGHAVGDQVLLEAATRLRDTARASDIVARLGGDEFIVVLDDLEEIAIAVTVAGRIVDAMAQPFTNDDLTVSLSASVGIAWSPRGATTAPKLLVQADLALYRAKARGKGRTELFDEHLQQTVDHRARVETALADAIDTDGLELWFQPIFDNRRGTVWGVEALVRWPTADAGLRLPAEFIPVAERSDLILELDRYVLAKACRHLSEWDDHPTRDLHLAVNVSGRHLDTGDLHGDLQRMFEATGATPERLMVEMTETSLVKDLDQVSRTMSALRDLGVGVAIDDFGTGYASVAHLRQLPATHLKIDRSFVSGSENQVDRSILELLAWLGDALGLDVVAEGVEDERQLELITELGCTFAQGFLLGRPMPAHEIVPWLAVHGRREPISGSPFEQY